MDKKAIKRFEDTKDFHEKDYFEDFLCNIFKILNKHPTKNEKSEDRTFGWEKKFIIKGALSGLRKFLANESPLKMMKNIFHFTLKTLFFLKIFKCLFCFFCHVEKWFD